MDKYRMEFEPRMFRPKPSEVNSLQHEDIVVEQSSRIYMRRRIYACQCS